MFLHGDNYFIDQATIREIICAMFLNEEADPELCGIITAAIVRGLCNDENPECHDILRRVGDAMKYNIGFPKAFCVETTMQANGFPLFQRR
jgi:hypothetical protein